MLYIYDRSLLGQYTRAVVWAVYCIIYIEYTLYKHIAITIYKRYWDGATKSIKTNYISLCSKRLAMLNEFFA